MQGCHEGRSPIAVAPASHAASVGAKMTSEAVVKEPKRMSEPAVARILLLMDMFFIPFRVSVTPIYPPAA